ncbi:MAG: tRNA 2-thiouridine(34) synthase MnmA [Clostridia bacterium]|nr:tRNA 2-thiouridine(34) synthase MnmA [Clostridia bacterium]
MANQVVLGLSGGVDSAVAAARLRERGLVVHGLFLEMGLGGEDEARAVADSLGIPLHIAHRASELEREVCAYFAQEYRSGRTPNPCVVCNPTVKFKALVDYADEIGAAFVATGHYARTGRDAEGRALLLRAKSPKDQSYMLCRLPREIIARCIFPLGEAENKDEVRAEARERAVPVADRPDSMDVCFIPDGDVAGWLEKRGAALPAGDFVDEAGNVLGRHGGIHRYTVGQRRGLGVAAEGRLFVHALDTAHNRVVLGLDDVYRDAITVSRINWCAPEYAQNGAFSCGVRVRYSKNETRARVEPMGDHACVHFDTPVRAPAAGQAAVFYDGDIVLGGGFID